MPDDRDPRARTPNGPDRAWRGRITSIEIVALILSGLWLAGTGLFIVIAGPESDTGEAGGTGRFVMFVVAVLMPAAMIWIAAIGLRASRIMREESRHIRAAIDMIAHGGAHDTQPEDSSSDPSVVRKLEEIAKAQRKTESALAVFSSIREPAPVRPSPPAPKPATGDNQVALPLDTPAEDSQPPLERSDFIRALNFPETAEDKAGFAALRKALKDRPTAQLIQAAQDILTLMSQDGIYMDDLPPDMAHPKTWRRFAAGERGRAIASLGGIRDRSSLALTATRMRQDAIFRDAAHHFLRRFDRMFTEFAETATDAEISELSDTRTARAFMLLGRVAGTFD